jgi:periplasmic copper chaperone A
VPTQIRAVTAGDRRLRRSLDGIETGACCGLAVGAGVTESNPSTCCRTLSVQPVPGWDVTTTARTLDQPREGEGSSISEVVDTITWTATGDTQIAPGQFQLFWISAGQMPSDADELSFPAIQTYSSGEEVAWIETAGGGAEPEHPAPTVDLVAATPAAATTSGDDADSSDTLAIVALVVGGVGLLAAIAALLVARRAPSPA